MFLSDAREMCVHCLAAARRGKHANMFKLMGFVIGLWLPELEIYRLWNILDETFQSVNMHNLTQEAPAPIQLTILLIRSILW